jgi:hypothetical protein
LSLAICINPFIIMRENNYASVLYLLVFTFILFLWATRSTGLINKIIYSILLIISVLLPILGFVYPSYFKFLSDFQSINFINSVILLLMLYWVRWWVVKPYDYLPAV